MEENRFFKTIWRINALLFLLIVIGFAVFWTYLAISFSVDSSPNNALPPSVVGEEEGGDEDQSLRIKIPSQSKNVENFLYFELRSGKDEFDKFSSHSRSQLRNISVFDQRSNTSSWVFPNANQEIERFRSIEVTAPDRTKESQAITKGFLLVVAKTGANKEVVRDLWLMSIDGKDLKRVLERVSDSVELRYASDEEVKLVVERENIVRVYDLNTDSLTLGDPVFITYP